jgi:hypothetical protein
MHAKFGYSEHRPACDFYRNGTPLPGRATSFACEVVEAIGPRGNREARRRESATRCAAYDVNLARLCHPLRRNQFAAHRASLCGRVRAPRAPRLVVRACRAILLSARMIARISSFASGLAPTVILRVLALTEIPDTLSGLHTRIVSRFPDSIGHDACLAQERIYALARVIETAL